MAMSETKIWGATVILNGLFLIFLNVLFWKKTAGRRALWAAHLSTCLWFFMPFLVISMFFELMLLPIVYGVTTQLYPYAWLNTVAAWAVMCLLFFMALEYLFLWRVAGRWLVKAKSKAPPRLWPFSTPLVREIHAHMTDAEKSKMEWFALRYGLWVGGTFAIPLTNLILHHENPLVVVISAILVTTFIICLPYWLKTKKQMLCSTTWAKEQGVTPDQIKRFAFRI